MKYAVFGYSTPNLGDDVQSLAAALLLPRVDAYVDRDRLDRVRLSEPHRLIMNSWFAIKRYAATPHASLLPHYFGYCVGRQELINPAWLSEWKRREPIGCRDLHSVAILQNAGIAAHFTGCLTTWMGRFFEPSKRDGVLFIDVPETMDRFIPEQIRSHARRITNGTANRNASPFERFRTIASTLDAIRTAEMVVTRRLHAALPCVGFGTPVTVYLDGSDIKNRRRFSGSDQFLPIVFHDGAAPDRDSSEWLEPACPALPAEMETRFRDLCSSFGATPSPKWASVAQFASTMPEMPREPRSYISRLLRAA